MFIKSATLREKEKAMKKDTEILINKVVKHEKKSSKSTSAKKIKIITNAERMMHTFKILYSKMYSTCILKKQLK